MKIYTDGASRGNPGKGAAAFVEVSRGKTVFKASAFLGMRITNNEAEYKAIILALKHAIKKGAKKVEITTDSMVVSQQIAGKYKVKSPKLAALLSQVKSLAGQLKQFKIQYAPRETKFIAEADKTCNELLNLLQ